MPEKEKFPVLCAVCCEQIPETDLKIIDPNTGAIICQWCRHDQIFNENETCK